MIERSASLEFSLDWDPLQFLKSQYVESKKVSLGDVLCVCGDAVNAFVTTGGDYLHRWSPNVGSAILSTLEAAMKSNQREAEGM